MDVPSEITKYVSKDKFFVVRFFGITIAIKEPTMNCVIQVFPVTPQRVFNARILIIKLSDAFVSQLVFSYKKLAVSINTKNAIIMKDKWTSHSILFSFSRECVGCTHF